MKLGPGYRYATEFFRIAKDGRRLDGLIGHWASVIFIDVKRIFFLNLFITLLIWLKEHQISTFVTQKEVSNRYSITTLKTLEDLQEAIKVARVDYDQSMAKMVPSKKTIRKSKKMAFLSAFSATKSTGVTQERDAKTRASLHQSHHTKSKRTGKEPPCRYNCGGGTQNLK